MAGNRPDLRQACRDAERDAGGDGARNPHHHATLVLVVARETPVIGGRRALAGLFARYPMPFRAYAIGLGLAAGVLAGIAERAPAAAQEYPPKTYAPLLFNPATNQLVYRQNGLPWSCQPESCRALEVAGIPERDLAQASITALGFADRRFYLMIEHANHDRGRAALFGCADSSCQRLELAGGEVTALGTFQIKVGDKPAGRVALLRRADDGRSRLYWCSDAGCVEQQATRDGNHSFALLGRARHEEHDAVWLREKSGWVMRCQPEVANNTDQLACQRTSLAFRDFLTGRQAAAPTPLPAVIAGTPAPTPEATAPAAPPPPAAATNRTRYDRARVLITDARRMAEAGDFVEAEEALRDAAWVAPGFGEIARARSDIARLRSERERRFAGDRTSYVAAVEQAMSAGQMWHAGRLIGEAEQRFPGDPWFAAARVRLAELQGTGPWQARIDRALDQVAAARRFISVGNYERAETSLAVAAETAPGLPELREARRELERARFSDR
jgi:hypothetical protein